MIGACLEMERSLALMRQAVARLGVNTDNSLAAIQQSTGKIKHLCMAEKPPLSDEQWVPTIHLYDIMPSPWLHEQAQIKYRWPP